jgi:hypothetical protein
MNSLSPVMVEHLPISMMRNYPQGSNLFPESISIADVRYRSARNVNEGMNARGTKARGTKARREEGLI